MDKLGINLGFLLFQIFNFLVLMILMYAFAYRPIVNMLEKRKQKIAEGMEDARVASEARANAEKEAARIIAEAQNKASQTIREATDRAEQAAKDVRAAADAEIAKAREGVLAEAESERNRMLGDLRGQIAALSIAATQKLIGEALDEKRQHALIQGFFSGITSGKVAVLADAFVSGTEAEVISALPLTVDEQDAVKKEILAKAGGQVGVSFRVDPAILGGLVIRIGDKILDGSVAGQIEDLRQTLK